MTCQKLRHSFATHLLEPGYYIRALYGVPCEWHAVSMDAKSSAGGPRRQAGRVPFEAWVLQHGSAGGLPSLPRLARIPCHDVTAMPTPAVRLSE